MVMFTGPIAFPITPFDAHGDLDLAGIRTNAELLANGAISSIVAPSGTGEFFSLSPEESARVTQVTVEAVGKRKPVIAAVGIGPRVAAELARIAKRNGADGLLVLPPYYQNPDPEGLLEYYLAVARATDLPFAIYARDAAVCTPELVCDLAERAKTFAAFKDGRGDVRLFMRVREHVVERFGRDRLAFLGGVGDDLLAPYFAAGAQGFTSSMACFWPEIAIELWEARTNSAALSALHERAIRPFYEMRARKRGYEVSVMKAAMAALGYPAGPPRAPLLSISPEEGATLSALLRKLGVPTMASRGALV